jgi:protein TonB
MILRAHCPGWSSSTDHTTRRTVSLAVAALHALLAVVWLNAPRSKPLSRPVAAVVFAAILPSEPVNPLRPEAQTATPSQPVRAPSKPPAAAPAPRRHEPEAPAPSPAGPAGLAEAPQTHDTNAPAEHAPALTSAPAPPAVVAPPPPPAAPRELVVTAVEYLAPPVLQYPPASRRMQEQGRVLVRVLVDAQGLPAQISLQQSSGHGRLDDAALATVRATRFKPYTENGRPLPFWVVMPLVFQLDS